MEKYTNSKNLNFYKKSLESKKYQVIDKFFRFWITKSFASHFINWISLHKTFLDDKNNFDKHKFEVILNYFIVQDIFTKTKTIRYDNVWEFIDKDYIEWILIQNLDIYKLFWNTKFEKELSEFNFSNIKKTNMWDFSVILDNNITEEQIKIVDNWLEKYLEKIYNELLNLIIENKTNREIWDLKHELVKKVTKILL
jgi:hypothetical protein